jgi:hypothetical protein
MLEEKKDLIEIAVKQYLDIREQSRCIQDEEDFAYRRLLDLCRQEGDHQDRISDGDASP